MLAFLDWQVNQSVVLVAIGRWYWKAIMRDGLPAGNLHGNGREASGLDQCRPAKSKMA
jgi:hypothetical protein